MPQTPRQRTGAAAEEFVARRLAGEGWRILGRNVRLGREEVDLVAVDPGPPAALVVLEVRWRGSRLFGLPEETVDRRKWAALWRATVNLLESGSLPDGTQLPRLPLRLDLVAVDRGRSGSLAVRHHRGFSP